MYAGLTQAPPEVIGDLVDASETAYQAVAAQTGRPAGEIHTRALCVDVIRSMGGALCANGKGYRAAWRETAFGSRSHMLLSLYPPGFDIRLFADPVWQQFRRVGMAAPDLPKLLVGTSPEMVAQALAYGFNEHEAAAWRF